MATECECYLRNVGGAGQQLEFHYCSLHDAAPDLLRALKRVLPMARACKHEDFSDITGNEDTRTAALHNALAAIAKAEGQAPVTSTEPTQSTAALPEPSTAPETGAQKPYEPRRSRS